MATTTSIVIPSFQGARRLEILLGRLADQTTTHEWEAIVVLDGSTDESAAVIDRWSERVPVRAIDLGTNRGRSVALNTGLRASLGQVLIRCDDDLAPRPDFVHRHTMWHLERGPVGVIGLYRNLFPETTFARVYGRDADRRYRDEAYAAGADRAWRFWAGNCSISRDTLTDVGLYDEEFRDYGWEDTDWGYRLRAAGVPIVLDPELETDHHIASTTTAIRVDRSYRSGLAERRFMNKFALTDHPFRAAPVAPTPWTRLVHATSSLSQSQRMMLARLVDRVGSVLPKAVGRRSIGLLVESSHRGGSDQGA